MPSVPTYLSGVHSNKVRNLLNYFNGAAGILTLKPVNNDPTGLSFDVTTLDPPQHALEWACGQVGLACRADGAGIYSLAGGCESAGKLTGSVRMHMDDKGAHISQFRIAAIKG